MGTKKSVSVIRRLLKGIKGKLQLLRVSFFGEREEKRRQKELVEVL